MVRIHGALTSFLDSNSKENMGSVRRRIVGITHADPQVPILTEDGTRQQIVITVNGTNDPAVFGGDLSSFVTEDDPNDTLTGTVSSTDPDNPDDTFMAVTTPTSSNGGLGTYTLSAVGDWQFQLNNANATVNALGQGQSTTETFDVVSIDGTTGTVGRCTPQVVFQVDITTQTQLFLHNKRHFFGRIQSRHGYAGIKGTSIGTGLTGRRKFPTRPLVAHAKQTATAGSLLCWHTREECDHTSNKKACEEDVLDGFSHHGLFVCFECRRV